MLKRNWRQAGSIFLRIHQSFLVNYDYVKKINFFNMTIRFMEKELELKISEDRQKKCVSGFAELQVERRYRMSKYLIVLSELFWYYFILFLLYREIFENIFRTRKENLKAT